MKILHQEGLSYTVYNNPRDFPGKVVVRGWVGGDSAGIKAKCDTIEEAQALMPEGLRRIPPCSYDDPVIVEFWVE